VFTCDIETAYQFRVESCEDWYAIHTKSRHEKIVATILTGKGFHNLLPLYKRRHQRPGRTRESELPAFPGYLFCEFDPRLRLPILTTPGVLNIVANGRTPSPIERTEIEAIQRLVDSPLQPEPWPFLAIGQRAYVCDGPLQGIEGILVAWKNSHRLILSATLLRRSIAVEIEREWVVPCPPRISN
jgi:transcriptional antiterminator NusG